MVGSEKTDTKSFLTGMKYIPADALTDEGIDHSQISKITATSFVRQRSKALYGAPLVLIRKNERLQMDYWDDGPIAFTSTIVGIGVGRSSLATLKRIYSRLRNRHSTYRFSCVLHGSKAFVSKATAILKQDIDSLPFPEDASELSLSYWEQII